MKTLVLLLIELSTKNEGTEKMPVLTCKDLSMSYENVCVLSGLSFKLNSGSYLCVVGENGSGKSTLIKCILGLIRPSGGEFELGENLTEREIGYLPQQRSVMKDFPASVFEVVLSGTKGERGFLPFYTKKNKDEAMRNLVRLRIDHLKNKNFCSLSGGQQQRVLLARALCATKKLLLLDEPTSGLDPLACADMYAVIKELNKKDGITVIMVSHDILSAVDNASHILHLSGSETFFGTSHEYMHSDLGGKFIFHSCSCDMCIHKVNGGKRGIL